MFLFQGVCLDIPGGYIKTDLRGPGCAKRIMLCEVEQSIVGSFGRVVLKMKKYTGTLLSLQRVCVLEMISASRMVIFHSVADELELLNRSGKEHKREFRIERRLVSLSRV